MLIHSDLSAAAQVTILLPPIQPDVLDELQDRFSGFDAARREAVIAAQSHCGPGVHVYDLTDVRQLAPSAVFADDLFRDQHHLTPEGGRQLAAAVEQGAAHDMCGTAGTS